MMPAIDAFGRALVDTAMNVRGLPGPGLMRVGARCVVCDSDALIEIAKDECAVTIEARCRCPAVRCVDLDIPGEAVDSTP